MTYVKLEAVGKTFRTRQGGVFHALKGVDLAVEKGEFVSLIGHSGCGKSTVLNLVAGLLPVTEGSILVNGARVTRPGPDRMVAFQNHSLLPWLSLRKNVELAVESVHTNLTRKEQRDMASHYLGMVNLAKAAERLPSEVSGGMKQRCGIARALATQPQVLLLDEPFGALDALTRATLQDELVRIWEAERLTVIMITHDVEEALLLSDRIIMMSNGPAARVADAMVVDLPRPRRRLEVIDHPSYYRQRGELLYFLNKCKKEKKKPKPARITVEAPGILANGLEKDSLVVGYVPLLDAAPFVAAESEGFFEANGLKVSLSREPSWRAISDGLREGRLDAAQMIAGGPLAETLGVGRPPVAMATAMTLSRGGNAITFGNGLIRAGVSDRVSLRAYLAQRQEANQPPLMFGMVHPASMHNLLLRAWLAAADIDPDKDLKLTVVPPPQMIANLEAGNLGGYCVGEPWNLRAVEQELGMVVATDSDIWPDHPEKVLGVTREWAVANPKTHAALVAAMLSACAKCDEPAFRAEALPTLLAERRYVGGARGALCGGAQDPGGRLPGRRPLLRGLRQPLPRKRGVVGARADGSLGALRLPRGRRRAGQRDLSRGCPA